FAHFGGEGATAFISEVTVHDDGKSIDGIAGDEDVELGHGRFPVAREVIVERRVATRDGFQTIVKVQNDFVQRQFVLQHYTGGADVFETFLLAALLFHQFQNVADKFFGGKDSGKDDGLLDLGYFALVGPLGRIVDFDQLAVGLGDLVTHAGGGGNEVEVVLAF